MIGIGFIAALIFALAIMSCVIIYNMNDNDSRRAKYEISAIAVLLLLSSVSIAALVLCCIYDDYDDMRVKQSFGDQIRVIELPADDITKVKIDFSKEKPIYMKTYYECGRVHDHIHERCVNDRKCYRMYFEKNVIDKYDVLTNKTED